MEKKRFLTFILSVSVLFLAATAQAATYTVPDDYSSIQATINDAGYGDTILVEPGTYNENLVLKSGVVPSASWLQLPPIAKHQSTLIFSAIETKES